EGEFGVRRDHAAGATLAVRQIRRNHELAFAADLHPGDAFVPALDDLPGPELEAERFAAIEAAVELLAVLERAGVMHVHGVAGFGLGPRSDGLILVLQTGCCGYHW